MTFLMLVKPMLLKQQGFRSYLDSPIKLPLSFAVKKPGIRREYLRVALDTQQRLCRHPNQSSGMLSSASWAQGLAVIPEHQTPKEGELVDFFPFNTLLNLPID